MAGWFWPFDAVQGWFEDLWNWVSEATVNAVSIVWDWINDAISGLWDTIYNNVVWIVNVVGSAVSGLWDNITGAFSSLWDTIYSNITWIINVVSGGLETLWTSITGALSGAVATLTDWFGNVWEFLSSAVGEVGSTLARGITSITDWVSKGLGDLWAGFTEWGSNALGIVTTMFDGAVATVNTFITPAITGLPNVFITGLTGFYRDLSSAAETALVVAITNLTGAAALLRGSPQLVPTPVAPGDAKTFLEGYADKGFWDFVQAEASLVVIEAASFGQIDIGPAEFLRNPMASAYASVIEKVAVTEHLTGILPAYEQYYLKEYRPMVPAIEDAQRMLWRGVLSLADFTDVVARQGFGGLFETGYLELTKEIPGPVDLIRFVVREVIAPSVFSEYMGYQGYSETISGWFWEAHWVLPAFGQLVDAFHRGIITDTELNTFIVWHDYSPTARPGIGKSDVEIMRGLLKRLIPRVDLRYAWEMGKLTDEELEARYISLGYEEDAALMTEIQMARALVEEIHKVRDEWIRDYLEGYILEDVLRANLAAIGIGPLRIDYYVEYARMRREREYKADLLDAYWDGYLKDLVTDEELAKHAADIIVDEPARALWLEKAYIRKYKKPKAD